MGYGPYGAIGIGEDVATVVPALVGPAVHNAIGVAVDDFPITPAARACDALGKANKEDKNSDRRDPKQG